MEKPKKPEIHVEFRGGRIPRSEYEALSKRKRFFGNLDRALEPMFFLLMLEVTIMTLMGWL